MLKEIYKGLLNQDPKKRFSIQMIQEKMNSCLKANKIVLPPMSQDYTVEDFQPFFDHVAKEKGKDASMFKDTKETINLLGLIPLQIKERVNIKDLPFHKIKDKKGHEAIFQGNLEKGQPKGVGLKYTDQLVEFGFYGDFPFSVY